MAVYNGEQYLCEAINSILNQIFTDYEFIIIDDGSTDGTLKILKEYAKQDKRIRLIRNMCNIGLTCSLNKGLSLARGTYIARQDSDDISLPDRLALQVRFLENHPEIGVVGTWVAFIDKEGRQTGIWRTLSNSALIKWSLLFGNCLAHSSVMMRRSLLEESEVYSPEIIYAQDYKLWIKLSRKTQLTNLSKILYLRRTHEGMIGVRHYEQQQRTTRMLMQQNIENLIGTKVPEAFVAILWSVEHHQFPKAQGELVAVTNLIKKLYQAFNKQNKIDRVERRQIAENAAQRILSFLQYLEQRPAGTIQVMLHALCLNWQVVDRSHIKTILHNLFKPAFCGKL